MAERLPSNRGKKTARSRKEMHMTTIWILSARLLRSSIIAVALVFVASAAAYADDWKSPWDTDNLDRSVPSNRAYITGSFTWQRQDTSAANFDERAEFSTTLYLRGPDGSCARLRVITFVGDRWRNAGEQLEKRFPGDSSANFGYNTFCQTDGWGSVALGGSDVQDRSFWDIGRFKAAKISICWTRDRSTPPGGDCYNFTVHPGD